MKQQYKWFIYIYAAYNFIFNVLLRICGSDEECYAESMSIAISWLTMLIFTLYAVNRLPKDQLNFFLATRLIYHLPGVFLFVDSIQSGFDVSNGGDRYLFFNLVWAAGLAFILLKP